MVKRFWEIDFLRGTAVVMMIAFHFIYSLDYFGRYAGSIYSQEVILFGRSIGIVFVFLVGVSLSISYSRVFEKLSEKELLMKYVKRGSWIFFWGLLITAASWLFYPKMTIFFGVLHLIGLSIILGYLFLRFSKYVALVSGLALSVLGIFLQKMTFSFSWLLWLGFQPEFFATYDYFPLLPWFGLILIGISFGKFFYEKEKRKFRFLDSGKKLIVKQFCFLGRHSLVIYLAHVPILLGLLYLMG